ARRVTDYILQSDAIGASYLRLGITDSAMIYYQKISGVLAAYPSLDENYKKIWTGIVAGETGQALFLQKKYAEASPLLAENVRSSYALGQFSDAAHAQNTLARIGFIEKKYASALTGWRNAWQWSLKSGDLESAVSAVSGIMEVYRSTGRYDSAFRYNDLFHTYRDSLIEKINNGRLATVTARIDDDNMQASLLTAQKVISGQRRTRNIILAGILIATVLALTFYSRYNQKQNYHRELLERRNQLTAMEIAHAREQIADFTRNISTKNRLIENMQAKLDQEITAEAATTLRHFTILTDEDWQNFKDAFGKLHPGFWNTLDEKFPDLTLAEKRFMALSRLGLNNKEMASSMGVSPQTIRVLTYRLRKKMDIPETAGLRALAQNI
ncbi:MAG TPA: LuxR C-terminal-related transcriptional regulator, partial [Chitinophagaceae bacterium]